MTVHIDLNPIPGQEMCDLCRELHPTWRYPVKDFLIATFDNTEHMSKGDWAACDRCHRCIELGELEILSHLVPFGDRDDLRPLILLMWEKFTKNVTGPATPIPLPFKLKESDGN